MERRQITREWTQRKQAQASAAASYPLTLPNPRRRHLMLGQQDDSSLQTVELNPNVPMVLFVFGAAAVGIFAVIGWLFSEK